MAIPIIPPLSFTTPRLTLQAARPEHAKSLFEAYTGQPEAALYLQRRAHSSPAQTLAVIETWGAGKWPDNDRFAWTILLPEGKAIGLFLMLIDNMSAEIHYGIGTTHWGHGFATEAGKAVMSWVVNESGLSHVATCCATQHIASLKVLEKIGLARIKLLPAHIQLAATGLATDGWLYRWTRS